MGRKNQETPRVGGPPRTPNYVNHRDRADKRGKLSIPVMSGPTATRSLQFRGEGTIHNDLLASLILRKPPYESVNFMLFDCRYPYEFEAGSISGSQNVYLESKLKELLFADKQPITSSRGGTPDKIAAATEPVVLIFHCEFSSYRAPRMANFVRDVDRKFNEYPNLHYPELIILEGGFRDFYHALHKLPGAHNLFRKIGYVSQMDSNFKAQESKCLQEQKREKHKTRHNVNTIRTSRLLAHKISEEVEIPTAPTSSNCAPNCWHEQAEGVKTPEIRKSRRLKVKKRNTNLSKPKSGSDDAAPPDPPRKRKRTTSIRERNPFESASPIKDDSPVHKDRRLKIDITELSDKPPKALEVPAEKPVNIGGRLRSRGRSFYGIKGSKSTTSSLETARSTDSGGLAPTPREIGD